MSLNDLIKISNKYGKDPEFVLAGGGNTSFKDSDYLYIKGSGTTLATIKGQGFVKMNREKLNKMFERTYSKDSSKREEEVLEDMMDAREKTELNKRPSVETLLHNLFQYSFVVHTHPPMLNGLTCGQKGKEIADELFGNQYIWIDLVEPGYVLATLLKKAMEEYKEKNNKDADIIILQNHGLFIAGNTEDEIDRKTKFVFDSIKTKVKREVDFSPVDFDRERATLLAPAIRMLLKDNDTSIVTFNTNKEVLAFLQDPDSFYPVSSAYSPDHIVYCRPWPLFVESVESIDDQYDLIEKGIRDYEDKHGFKPKLVCIQGLGYYAYGNNKKTADTTSEVFLDTLKIGVYSQFFGGPLFMTDYMIDFIVNWEVEAYRSKVSMGASSTKRLNEKIAIVTGSAQGFGQGIAYEMLKQGANVTIADLNFDLAKENSEKMNVDFGPKRTLAVKVDVSKEDDVKHMVYDTVLEYGGLDVFVNNAGIAIAGDLEEMTIEKFELVTKINYLAYYLGSKYASRIMKIQNRFNKDYPMDIIQINSKSGLVGSNKNFAYAGSKFGGIGLTQSFALELIPYNIKVNAICPGNLLSGPLWSDPEKGLFVQYFKAGKVPGAKTVDDVKAHYENLVPMKRGCEIIDVARAIFYVVEQEYETGQAIPVTGGQNMLK